MRIRAARSNDAISILPSSSYGQHCIILPSALSLDFQNCILLCTVTHRPNTTTTTSKLNSMWTWSLLYGLNSALPGLYRAVSYVTAKPFGRTCHLHHQTKGFPNSTEICGRIKTKVYTGHGFRIPAGIEMHDQLTVVNMTRWNISQPALFYNCTHVYVMSLSNRFHGKIFT
jgi:hypothetical protein